ncbi:hypothetical protein [Tunturiibacter gelidoferens]|uniref:Uncharacterized protein n=1 Tax=Tunturiibacter lichenicola TaxID=2051959 RepID=A0A7Y9NRP4_9BACT|nr:hypothetical protein [Edaphobacter lichenicola]NYF54092.1 hypothetical protein [Edaphobacter lichenicola]
MSAYLRQKTATTQATSIDDQLAQRAMQAFGALGNVNGENRLWLHFVEDWLPIDLSTKEDRTYNLAQVCDTRPDFTPSWFLPDERVSDNYGDFLGTLHEENRTKQKLDAATDRLVSDFFSKYNKALEGERRLRSKSSPKQRAHNMMLARDSILALDSARKTLRSKLATARSLGPVDQAYYDFIDSDETVSYQGDQVTIKPFNLSPDLEGWIKKQSKTIELIASGTAEIRVSDENVAAAVSSNGVPSDTPVVSVVAKTNLYAAQFGVFAISRKPWFHQELLETYRHDLGLSNQLTRFYGRDGLLRLIPVALVVVKEPVYIVTLSATDFAKTQALVDGGKQIFISIAGNRMALNATGMKADPKTSSWKIIPATPDNLQLIAVISEAF